MYLTWAKPKPLDDPKVQASRWWTATVAASLSFLDTLLYFNFMIAIAGCLYHWYGTSVYEKSTSMLVADFVSSATFSASILYRYSHDGMKTQIGLQMLPTVIRFFLEHFGIQYMRYTPLVDSLCIERPNFALSHLNVSFLVQMSLILCIVCGVFGAFLFHGIRSRRQQPNPGKRSPWLGSWASFKESQLSRIVWIVVSLSLLGYMWLCFAFITQIRNKARYWFSHSYTDNEMGYGQIIAMGFCLQTVVLFIYELIGMSHSRCSKFG